MKQKVPLKLKQDRNTRATFQSIMIGFAIVIIIGAILLAMPFSSREGVWTDFLDCLFTSTSATCVTGLVVKDAGTYWSFFGQLVILLLIQIGGLGVVTISVAMSIKAGEKISLIQRSVLEKQISANSVGGLVGLTKFIIWVTFALEGLGALCILPVFLKDFDVITSIWYSIFHAVSAFCNAGFDLMGVKGQFSSLSYYQGDIVINVVIMLLIILGGLGFLTWEDIARNGFHFQKYSLQSKIIVVMTVGLILIPTVFFFFLEFDDLNLKNRILASFFQTVTCRTAGFSTINYDNMTEVGLVNSIVLMLIGAAPGSTAGGMKVTTIAVFAACIVAVFKHDKDVRLFRRRIPSETVRSASAVFALYVALAMAGAMLICAFEEIPFIKILFECSSAIGTVGSSCGCTPDLCGISHVILILLMYIGRIGGFTLAFAFISELSLPPGRFPEEDVNVG